MDCDLIKENLPNRLRIYTTSWCPDCRNAKRFLDSHQIIYEEVDIDKDPEAEAFVIRVSGGRRVIPTVCLEDTYLFNPPLLTLAKLVGLE